MIPYDDLVIALQTWRAQQGLPVAQMVEMSQTPQTSGSLTPPPPPPPAAVPRRQPPAAPGSGPHDDALDVDGALIEEAHYVTEGDDFAMAFAGTEHAESTAIGQSPGPSDHTIDEGGTEVASSEGRLDSGPGRTEDW